MQRIAGVELGGDDMRCGGDQEIRASRSRLEVRRNDDGGECYIDVAPSS